MAPQQGPTTYHDNVYPIPENLTACHLDSYMAGYAPPPPPPPQLLARGMCCAATRPHAQILLLQF
jgi:hypothetical protein